MWYYYCVKAPLATSYHLTPMILIIVREFRRRVLMRGFGGSTSSCRRHYYLFMRNGGPIFKSFCIPEAGSTPAAIILLSSFFMSVIMSRALRLLFFHDFFEFDKRFHDTMFNISFAIIARLQRKSCFIKGEERSGCPIVL